jgi:phenylacetate-CoA ligase
MNLLSKFFFIKYNLGKPGSYKQYIESTKIQDFSKEDILKIQWMKLDLLLKVCLNDVPFYKNFFNSSCITLENIKSKIFIQQLPIVSRSDLINNYESFISKKINPNSLKISTTGGSTGTPVKIGMDPSLVREVPKWQMFSWWGLSPSDNMATIYRGLPVQGLKKIGLDFINWPQKTVRLDATDITADKIETFINECQQVKPKLIHGYVGAIDAIADYILDHKISFPSPRVIWTTAAPITAVQVSKIERAFGAPVCDQYGCSELYFIAAECPSKNGLHIFADSVKVEILDDNDQPMPDGEYGRIVITNLNDHAFPLIRYANGDVGRLLTHECSCGMKLPLLDKVKGRISDNISLPNGTVLSGEYLTTLFDDYTDAVKQFQVVQEKTNKVIVKTVFHDHVSDQESVRILLNVKNELDQRIRQQVPLAVEKVKSITMVKGKLQFIIKEK